jgi:ATP-dependent DNA helicase RecG
MTTLTDLLEIIRNGENSGVEFKRDVIQSHDLAKELVAFTNFEGGKVLLGVEDDGSITGITRPDLEEWVMTTCRDKIRPAIIPQTVLKLGIRRCWQYQSANEMGY